MKRPGLLLTITLFSLAAFSQKKDYTQFVTTIDIDGSKIQSLRLTPPDVDPKIWNDIFQVQYQLDRNREFYLRGNDIEFGSPGKIALSCEYIAKRDSSFPVSYFREEAKAYQEWSGLNHQKKTDALNADRKAYDDSVRVVEMKKGYRWIVADSVWVKTKPDARSANIGVLHRLSYVKAFAVEGQPDWVELDFAEHSGYIPKTALAMKWEDMSLADDELTQLKEGRYFAFDPTPAYQAKMDRAAAKDAAEAAAEERAFKAANAAPAREYIRGPKNGCYFINSHGNKQYVDKRYCN